MSFVAVEKTRLLFQKVARLLLQQMPVEAGDRETPSFERLLANLAGQPGSLLALAKGDAGAKHRAQADNYTDINSSDIDFCEVPGNATHGASTYIVYCTGDQRGGPGFNAAAIVAALLPSSQPLVWCRC